MDPQLLKNILMRYGSQIGLKPNQKDVLWQLLDHDFTGKGYSFPSLQTIATRIGFESEQGVRKVLKSIISMRPALIKRIEVPGKPCKYHFAGLISRLTPYHQRELRRSKKVRYQQTLTPKQTITPEQSLSDPSTNVSRPLNDCRWLL